MTFARHLKTAATLVEARLAELLDAEWLAGTAPPRLIEAMHYAVLGGGKRFRPFLLIESARLFAVPPAAAVNAAAALECVHCYSLVHDDLPAMDDDALRRGRPTVHVAFDEAIAILAGDALLAFAFDVLSWPETHASAEVRAALVLGLARAAGPAGMAGGQALDLQAEGCALDAAAVRHLQRLKTGALIAFACEAGAILGQASAGRRAALKAYGEAVGLAFQLADDLLDAEGDAASLGKATGKDSAAGKATIVAALGTGAARAELAALVEQAEQALAPFGAEAEPLAQAARFVAARRQ